MASSPARGQRPNIPYGSSEDTIWENDAIHEHEPLLSSPSQQTIAGQDEDDAPTPDSTTMYVKILTENLPWYKRPSAFWLFPISGLASISGGMLISSIGQFQAALLCREYLSRHAPSNTSEVLVNTAAEFTSLLVQATTAATSGGRTAVDALGVVPLRPGPECLAPEIQAFTAKTLGVIEVLGAVAATLSIGYYASLSDKHGRIKIIILAAINNLFMLCAIFVMGHWWDEIGLPLLVISGLVNGLLGGLSMGGTMALAYAADCTDPSRRSLIYSWLHAGLFTGLAIGSFIGGVIVRATGTIMTIIYIDIVATLVSLALVIFFMPESLPSKQSAHLRRLYEQATKPITQREDLKKPQEQHVAWHSHMFRSLRFFKPNGRNTNLILLAAISFLQTLALKGTFSVLILYTNRAFHWTEYEDGILFSLSSSVRLLSLLILLPVLVHLYHKRAASKGEQKDTTTATTAKKTSPLTSDMAFNQRNETNNYQSNHPDGFLVGGLDNLTVASSVEHLGEAALNLSDDEESFQERRRRQSTADSAATWSSDRTRRPSSPSSPSTKKTSSSKSRSRVRSKEQTLSGLQLDTWVIRLGFAINSVTYVGYGLATQGWHFYLWSALHAISIIAAPSLKSLVTNLVEPSQFGAVLGAFQVVDSIAGVFSPVMISWVYALTVGSWPEFVWYCCAALTGVCMILSFMIRQKQFYKAAV